jgi:carbamoylphosphate synthase large subunit
MNKDIKIICVVEPLASANYLAKRLKQSGFEIIALQINNNQSLDINLLNYMRSKIDYSLWDKVIQFDCMYNNWAELIEQLQKLNLDLVLYGCEYIVELADRLGQDLSLVANNPQTAIQRFHKFEMQEALQCYGLAIPQQFKFDHQLDPQELEQLGNQLTFPVIVKPVNSFASLNVSVVNSLAELAQINHTISSNAGLKIQQKIIGTEYIVDSFSWHGNHEISLVARYTKELFNQDLLYRSIDFVIPYSHEYNLLTKYIKQVLDALEFKQGLAHSEVFLTTELQPFLIEVNPRISGAAGTINQLALSCGGMDQISALVQLVKNIPVELKPAQDGRILFLYNYKPDQYFQGIKQELLLNLVTYQQSTIMKNYGDKLAIGGSLLDSFLYIILVSDNKEQLDHDSQLVLSWEQSGEILL